MSQRSSSTRSVQSFIGRRVTPSPRLVQQTLYFYNSSSGASSPSLPELVLESDVETFEPQANSSPIRPSDGSNEMPYGAMMSGVMASEDSRPIHSESAVPEIMLPRTRSPPGFALQQLGSTPQDVNGYFNGQDMYQQEQPPQNGIHDQAGGVMFQDGGHAGGDLALQAYGSLNEYNQANWSQYSQYNGVQTGQVYGMEGPFGAQGQQPQSYLTQAIYHQQAQQHQQVGAPPPLGQATDATYGMDPWNGRLPYGVDCLNPNFSTAAHQQRSIQTDVQAQYIQQALATFQWAQMAIGMNSVSYQQVQQPNGGDGAFPLPNETINRAGQHSLFDLGNRTRINWRSYEDSQLFYFNAYMREFNNLGQ